MSPVRRTWVPPHSSVENSPMPMTRTSSPYFSPNSAMAPALIASSYFMTRAATSTLRRISWLTSSSTWRICASLIGSLCEKSKRVRWASTSEPFCCTCGAQHLAQRRVHEMRGRVVPRRARARHAVHRGHHAVAHAQPAGLEHRPCGRTPRPGSSACPRRTKRAVDAGQFPAIADLAAGLGVERRAVEHHHRGIARRDFLDLRAFAVQRRPPCLRA